MGKTWPSSRCRKRRRTSRGPRTGRLWFSALFLPDCRRPPSMQGRSRSGRHITQTSRPRGRSPALIPAGRFGSVDEAAARRHSAVSCPGISVRDGVGRPAVRGRCVVPVGDRVHPPASQPGMGVGGGRAIPVVAELAPAVPGLIARLADRGLTRITDLACKEGFGYRALRVQDVSLYAIEKIVETQFYAPSVKCRCFSDKSESERAKVIAEVKKWWEQHGDKPPPGLRGRPEPSRPRGLDFSRTPWRCATTTAAADSPRRWDAHPAPGLSRPDPYPSAGCNPGGDSPRPGARRLRPSSRQCPRSD